jgi:peptidoglycan endopeptidase LytE
LTSCFPMVRSPTMAIQRLVILVAAFFLLAAPRPAFPDTTHVVGKGDTLTGIAKRHHVSVKKIKAANQLRSDGIAAGDKLKIPGKTVAKRAGKRAGKGAVASGPDRQAPAPSGVQPPSGPPQIHVVRKGETIGSLSRRYDVSEGELRRRNFLRRGKRLRPGVQIVVRAEMPQAYVVREDDTLFDIARKYGMSADELTVRNDLDSDRLIPGQELALREPAEESEAVVLAAASVPTEEELEEAALPQAAVQDNASESPQRRIIRVATKMLFIPYMWGGTTLTGIDCSGFVRKVFGLLNLQLPRSAREQFQVGQQVEKDSLSIGDLVFFQTYAKYPSHVGIYMGDNRFIHASSGSRQVKISSLDHPYYVKRFIGAKRLLFGENDILN